MSIRISRLAGLLVLACCSLAARAAPTCTAIAVAPGTTLSPATAGASYGPIAFTASGSSATPYTFDISSGLPAGSGLTLSTGGVLSGTPAQAGNFVMTVTATDTNGCSGGRVYALDIAQGNQTISFTSSAPAAQVGGPAYNVTATATSGLPVTLSIDASAASVCSIAGSTVSFTAAGTCVIDANQAGNASFNAAPQVQQSFAVGKGNQTITFTSVPPSNPPIGGPTYNVTATSNSGLPVTFTIDALASSVCSIAGTTVSFTGSGNCVIDANQAGDVNWNAAAQAQQTFGVAKKSQTISYTSSAPAAATVGGATYNVTATATSGLAVTFAIDATAAAVCSLSGSTVSFIGAGSCVIDANQAGDATYGAAPQLQQSFAVGKGSQTITYSSVPPGSAAVGGATYAVTATATSGLAVSFTIDATAASVCSIAGNVVSFTAAGTCVIDANQAGNASYNAAAQAQQSFAVGKGSQTISFTSSPPATPTVGGATYTVAATASSGLTVAFTIDATATSVCSIAGSTVSFIGAGTCVIDANQAGDANYNAAPQALQSFAVGKGNQTITFTSVPPASPTVGGPTYLVTATATSGLTVAFTIDATASSVCSIAGSTVSFIGSGTCVIDADQAGDGNWNAAVQAKQSFGVNKTNQTITFSTTAPVGAVVGGATYTPAATATSGLTVALTIDASAATVCSIGGGGIVSFIGAGTCVIDANQPGDTTYNAALQVQQSFAVGKGSQTISFSSSAPVGATVGGPTYSVNAGATSGLTVNFAINAASASVCSIAGNTVSFTGAGTCQIDATQPGDANWNAAPLVSQSFSVGPGNQTISFVTSAPVGAVVGGATYTPSATATSGLPVTLTIDISASTVCSISGGVVSFIGAGTCVIDANQGGDANYNAAPQAQQSFAVSKGSQAISFTSTPATPPKVDGPSYTPTATGGASGNPVVFTIDGASTSGCTISAGVVTFGAPIGTCIIDANQAGDANYNAALQVQQNLSVAIGDQTITFTSVAPAATVGGATYNVTATASSGLTPVTFAIDPASVDINSNPVCSIDTTTNTVSFLAVGTCIIDADQAGDANYNPAPQAQQSFAVAQGSQTISFSSTAPVGAKVGGPTYTVTASATSGLPVALTLDATSTGCSLAGNVVSFTAVGTCKIDANQAGDANYSAAPQVQQSFGVAKGDQTISFTSTAPSNALVGGPTYTVTATATSGLTVAFTIDASATSVCSIAGATVSFIAGGTCVIDANQAGNPNYNSAPQVQQSFTVSQPPKITSASSTTFAPGKTGQSFTVTTTGFPTPGLSVGSAFASGVTFTDNANGTATIAGTPAAGTQTGSPYVRTITANNGVNPNDTQNFTLNIVCPAISVSGASSLSAIFNTAMTPSGYSQVGGNGTIAWTAPGLPSGVSIDASGTISGTPSVTGIFSVTVTATDAGGCQGTKAVSFTSAPSAVGDSYSGMVDNTQAVVTGGSTVSPGTPFVSLSGGTLIANDLPSGGVAATTGTFATTAGGSVTIAADGTFIYTPKANSAAAANTSDSFTYTVTSNGATSAAASVSLTLSNRVWYVNNSGAAGNGQSQTPFNTLAAAAAASTANDIIFVYNGNGTNSGQNSGISLKNGQQLLGQANGLAVGSLTIAAGSRPTIGNSGGDGVTITNVTGVFVKGLSVAGSANGINASASAANNLTATVDNVIVTGATANNGIRVGSATTGTSNVTIQNSAVNAAAQNGIDARSTAAGTLLLDIDNDAITASGSGIVIDGSVAGTTTITGFSNNAISGNTGGSGILVTSAIFDATPGGTFQTVSAGSTAIGASGNGVGAAGMVLTNVSGDLSFISALDIFTSAGAGLQASGTTPYTGAAGFQIAVGAGVATITAVGGPAVNLSTVKANSLPFVSISSTGSPTTGVALNSLLGTFSAGAGSSISSTTGTGFQVGSSNATISYAGTINTTTGKGVDLTSNTGSTISFTGAMTLSSGANTTFNATGGGTVSTTDTTSTLTSTTGIALNVANTTIGAGGLKFRSITAGTAASGPTNGIVLNTTGAAGGLTVSGTGSAGSGGTIQKTTGSGISLSSVGGSASLTDMNISNTAGDGITGATVKNFSCSLCNVTNPGSSGGKDGLRLTNLSGAASLTNVTVTGATQDGCFIQNSNATLTSLTVTGGTYGSSNNAFFTAGSGMEVLAVTTGVITAATISGTTFSNNFSSGLQSFAQDTATIGDISVSGSTFTNNGAAAADFDAGTGTPNMKFHFLNNVNINGNLGPVVNVFSSSTASGGLIQGRIDGNHIGTAGSAGSGSTGGQGIRVFLQGVAGNITIVNNLIRETACSRGIDVETLGPASSGGATRVSDIVITNNDVNDQSTLCAFPVDDIYLASDNQAGTATTLRAEVHTNKIQAAGASPANTDYPFDGNTWLYFNVANTPSTAQLVDFGGPHANANAAIAATQTSGTAGALTGSPGVVLIAGPITTVP